MELLRTVPSSEVVKIKGGSAQESGLPDILFTCRALGGRAVWIEVKAPGEKPRKLQAYKLERWRRAGAISLVVHSVDELFTRLPTMTTRKPYTIYRNSSKFSRNADRQ